MQQQNALYQIQTSQDEQVILAIIALPQQSIQAIDQSERNVPLKSLLQLEELSKGRIVLEFTELFADRRLFVRVIDHRAWSV